MPSRLLLLARQSSSWKEKIQPPRMVLPTSFESSWSMISDSWPVRPLCYDLERHQDGQMLRPVERLT